MTAPMGASPGSARGAAGTPGMHGMMGGPAAGEGMMMCGQPGAAGGCGMMGHGAAAGAAAGGGCTCPCCSGMMKPRG